MSPKILRQQVANPLLRNPNMFHYSGYWGTWSRVLTCYEDPAGILELNLTPVNPSMRGSWLETVEPIVFRNHRTMFDRGRDLLLESLPVEPYNEMLRRLGSELTTRLLTADWLPMLDMPKVRRGRYGGGGIPFSECSARDVERIESNIALLSHQAK